MNDILRLIVKRFTCLRVLIIAHDSPPVFDEYDGFCCHIGTWGTGRPRPSRNFSFINAVSSDAVRSSLLQMRCDETSAPFDLIIIDHDHRLSAVVGQFNISCDLSHENTVFIFDDAVPKSLDMAGERPQQSWWLGQVWLLTQLLRPKANAGFLLTTDAPPTGMLVANQCAPISEQDVQAALCTHGNPARIEDIDRLFNHESLDKVFEHVSRSLIAAISGFQLPLIPATLQEGIAHRDVIDLEIERDHRAPAFVLDLSERNLNVTFLSRPRDRTPGKSIDTLENVYSIGHANFYKDGLFLRRDILYTDRFLARFSEKPATSEIPTIRKTATGYSLVKDYIDSARIIDEDLFFGTPDEAMNWGMWLIYGIPSAYYFSQHRREFDRYFCFVRSPWQSRLLGQLGVAEQDICPQELQMPYRCRSVTMIRHTFRNLSIVESDRALFGYLASKIASEKGVSLARGSRRRLFISRFSRTKQGAYRGLMNEEALANALTAVGFEIVEPEFLSFTDQVCLFSQAEVVVGLGGAGLFNVVFCQPGTKVVTIESSMVHIGSHSNIFATMGFSYGLIIGEEDLTDERTEQRRWRVDVDRALSAIRQFIG